MAKTPLTLPDAPRLQVIGLCRFSYLGEGGFKKLWDGSLADRRAMLYDPARLDARMIWFERVFLPGISRQTDPDFTMLVLTGEDFPEPFRSRLEALVRPFPQIRMIYRPPGQHRAICAEVVRQAAEPGTDVLAEFRLDDDDAVAVDYVAEIRRDFALLKGLYADAGALALDHSLGIVLDDRTATPPHTMIADQRLAQFWGCALTLFVDPASRKNVLDYVHQRVWQHMPSVMRAEKLMFVRGAHLSNDSKFNRPDSQTLMRRDKLENSLQDRFRIDLGGLERALCSLHQR